jgi:hypothetical protein
MSYKTGDRIRFIYNQVSVEGTVTNELDDGSLVIDTDGNLGFIIGLSKSSITHTSNSGGFWIPVAPVWNKNEDDLIKGFETMLGCEHKWEQASGWICGAITWKCTDCGAIKENK